MIPQNPFLLAGYQGPDYFCNRTDETRKLVQALENGRSVTLMAPRRMGKTGLIKNVFYRLDEEKKEVVTIYMDIFSTQNLREFVQVFASAVIGALGEESGSTLEKIGAFFKSLRPALIFDEYTGTPKITLDVVANQEETTLQTIFEHLQSSGKQCYIAIDEFQQIAEYPEKGVEAQLRSYIQFVPHVTFLFAGSKNHLMQEMFLSAKRPFFQSTQIQSIEAIDQKIYYEFASRFFMEKERTFPEDIFASLYNDFSGHTWYVQSILNRLYSYSHVVDKESLAYAVNEIVGENEYQYQNLLSLQTPGEIRLLKAIAKEGVVTEINAGHFIAKYDLKAASSVNSSLKRLIDKELVYKDNEGYTIYDRFMAIWLRKL